VSSASDIKANQCEDPLEAEHGQLDIRTSTLRRTLSGVVISETSKQDGGGRMESGNI
jgi:hypothetical protein